MRDYEPNNSAQQQPSDEHYMSIDSSTNQKIIVHSYMKGLYSISLHSKTYPTHTGRDCLWGPWPILLPSTPTTSQAEQFDSASCRHQQQQQPQRLLQYNEEQGTIIGNNSDDIMVDATVILVTIDYYMP